VKTVLFPSRIQPTPVTDVLERTHVRGTEWSVLRTVFLLRKGQQVFISSPSQNLQQNEEEAYAGVGGESKVIKKE
jgi:predicted nucleotidyltransferase